MTEIVPVKKALALLENVEHGELVEAVIELWDEFDEETHVYRYVKVSDHYPCCRWVKQIDLIA